ncbi:ribonucleoside-triphosphate reductase activating protein [Wenyingzhuangia fucanilytica]|uniref:Ribonucleoside-triphosphate reductase activating protein n=1 Tax=Wenyingzhuangia fucanilytica TaxID=1790137 RepID=A0A1B1Y7A9_9FLAO|nr:anaerobic ribonucleoside-triphosphate reductase activating protein [Wenyingzhuangia fucanilytica]ANW96653.1 ribonucleoside-triphosphate reductase activating protein [Wenyingzhuangia fucanilytica]
MYYYRFQIAFQEVPNEISLCFSICGCPLRCKGCHSPFLFKKENGEFLTNIMYQQILEKYKNYATCVLFMGGEWEEVELIKKLKIAKKMDYKTCLYTGLKKVDQKIEQELTWLKTGEWISDLGGLDKSTTNQIFTEVKTNKNLNYLFQKK